METPDVKKTCNFVVLAICILLLTQYFIVLICLVNFKNISHPHIYSKSLHFSFKLSSILRVELMNGILCSLEFGLCKRYRGIISGFYIYNIHTFLQLTLVRQSSAPARDLCSALLQLILVYFHVEWCGDLPKFTQPCSL